MNKTMWVLLEYYNSYDQQGGYFVGVFDFLDDIKANYGLGRKNKEDVWYKALEVVVGDTCDTSDWSSEDEGDEVLTLSSVKDFLERGNDEK